MKRPEKMRWSGWWIVACVLAAGFTVWSKEECRSGLGNGSGCSGFQRFAYDSEWLIVALIIAAFIGAFALNRVQVQMETRPCPRCGERVPTGVMECKKCGFDFRQIGAPGPSAPTPPD